MKRMIGIVGLGYVGTLVRNFYGDRHHVFCYDPKFKCHTQEEINNCEIVYVCVPTDPKEDGSCNTDIVEKTVEWIEAPIIVIKSTVEPGTTERLRQKTGKNIVFCPEYEGESSYWTPYKFHTELKETPFFIFGGEKEVCETLIEIYQEIAGPTKTYRITDSTTAELVKYLTNCFYATKVGFCNEMYDLAQRIGVSWTELRELWVLDPRLNPMHTLVFPDKRGFGGKCFPKDTEALLAFSKKMESPLTILDSVIQSNKRIRKEQLKDILS